MYSYVIVRANHPFTLYFAGGFVGKSFYTIEEAENEAKVQVALYPDRTYAVIELLEYVRKAEPPIVVEPVIPKL